MALPTGEERFDRCVSARRGISENHLWYPSGWTAAVGWTLIAVLFWAGCDAAGPPLPETANEGVSAEDALTPTGEAVSVRLLGRTKAGTRIQATSDRRHFCVANVMAPETEAGYRTYELGLSFADSLNTTGDATTTLSFDVHIMPPSEGTLEDYSIADSSYASRVRCWIPHSKAAAEYMGARTYSDVERVFGEDGYRILAEAEPEPGTSRKYMQDAPMDCGGTITTGCDMGEVVIEEPTPPLLDPLPPIPPTPPTEGPLPGDDEDGGGSGSGSSGCSKSGAAVHVPLFLFPRPDASKVIPLPGDPPSDDDPPSGGDCEDDDDGDDDGEEEPADEPVSKAEVATELIEACDLPPTTGQNDDVMSNIFEASINATLNASSPPSHNFRSGIHHQYADLLDGYSTAAFDMQDGSQLDLLTGIIESKFTEDPSSQISSGQSQGHINALASTYDLIPPGATFSGAPIYALVTNSQVPVEMIGRYSQGAGPYDLVTYANDRNVNVIHYRVMRTVLGNIKLEGDILGDAQTTRSAIQDFFGDFDVDFVIDCSPAN